MNTQLKRSICPYYAAKGKISLDFQIRIFPYCVAKEKIFIRLSEKNLS